MPSKRSAILWSSGLLAVLSAIVAPANGVRKLGLIPLMLAAITAVAVFLQGAVIQQESAASVRQASVLPKGFRSFRATYLAANLLCFFSELLPGTYSIKVIGLAAA